MTEQEQIEQLSIHILRRYFENLDIEPLLSSLAEDIVWLGAGKDMYRSGVDAVTAAFRQGIETMHPCVLSSLQITTRHLSPLLWLCQICSDIAPRPETQISLQEHQRCDFIFRRAGTSGNSTGWERVYLNNSMAYQPLRKKSFFATEQGIRNYELLHHVDVSHLSMPDKQALFALLERSAYRPLDADTQELFLILSQFQYFSETQAMYMCGAWTQKTCYFVKRNAMPSYIAIPGHRSIISILYMPNIYELIFPVSPVHGNENTASRRVNGF